jgi:hypothetical protein
MRKFRFIFWVGLFIIEASLVARFWVAPQFQTHVYDPHPALQFEVDEVMREHPALRAASIAFLGFFILANIGLMILIWRAFKDLQSNEKD